MARSLVGLAAIRAAVFEQVDECEGIGEVAVAEDQVLVVLDAALAVEIDVEELAAVDRLGDPGREVEAGHLLVPNLRVDAEQFGPLEGLDEGECVADGRPMRH